MSNFNFVKRIALAVMLFTAAVGQSYADEYLVQTVCAKYMGTGKEYKVNAQIMAGTELNRRANTYNYSSYSKYAVIFWAQDQVSIIELDYPGSVSAFGTSGKDQRGYKWELSTSTSFCG